MLLSAVPQGPRRAAAEASPGQDEVLCRRPPQPRRARDARDPGAGV